MIRGLVVVRALPRRALSRAVGALVRVPVPAPLLTPVLALYARAFAAELAEAAEPLGSHDSFLSFFTRHLKPGARPLPEDPDAIASPSDGRVHTASGLGTGDLAAGTLLQAKGVAYRLEALVADPQLADRLAGGTQLTIHLAPGDYHRFHWPFDARVDVVRHVPGDLWPVHHRAAAAVPDLFARNERVILSGTTRGAPFAIVAVGATNVGSIRLAFHPVRTNRGGRAVVRTWAVEDAAFARGDEMGWFEMGSTLIVLVSKEAGRLDALEPGAPLRAGQRIGHLATVPAGVVPIGIRSQPGHADRG